MKWNLDVLYFSKDCFQRQYCPDLCRHINSIHGMIGKNIHSVTRCINIRDFEVSACFQLQKSFLDKVKNIQGLEGFSSTNLQFYFNWCINRNWFYWKCIQVDILLGIVILCSNVYVFLKICVSAKWQVSYFSSLVWICFW